MYTSLAREALLSKIDKEVTCLLISAKKLYRILRTSEVSYFLERLKLKLP